jgi:hypothetical protein
MSDPLLTETISAVQSIIAEHTEEDSSNIYSNYIH